MKKLLIVALVLLVILGLALAGLAYADVRVRELAEAEAEKQLCIAVPQADRCRVEIEAFPFVGWVLVDGSVRRLVVTLDRVEGEGIEVEQITLEVDDLILDRDRLLDDQVLAITDVSKVRLVGRISEQAASKVVGVPIDLEVDSAKVKLHGRELEASVSVNGHSAVLSVTGVPPLVVPLPSEAYLPCTPKLDIEHDHLVAACSTSELPPALTQVLREGVG
jgi:hypothetical protein